MAKQEKEVHITKSELDRIDSLVKAGLFLDRCDCIQKAVAQLLVSHAPCQSQEFNPHFTSGWVHKPLPVC